VLSSSPVRFAFVLALVAACGGLADNAQDLPGDMGSGSGGFGSGSGGTVANQCLTDNDCVLASSTCCECPTFALPATANQGACGQVTCPPSSCNDNVVARCDQNSNSCTLACKPLQCDVTCDNGFVIDTTGCLTCECAPVDPMGCTSDDDCAEVPADCCGCALGGEDTSVLKADAASAIDNLQCPATPLCPGSYTCKPGAEPACVQSRCELLTPDDRTPPANECGLTKDPACPMGEVCTINAIGPATARGVGVCLAP